MTGFIDFNPTWSWMKFQHRLLAWVVLILLTLIFLLFPVKLISEYHPIQAPYIFNNLTAFAILFYVWMLLLFLLGFCSNNQERPSWEHLALSAIFGLCIIGFWAFITPYGSYADSLYNMGHVRYLNEFGRIPVGHPILAYFDFPGIHLLVSGISQITGLDVFHSQTLFLMVSAAFFPALLYVLFTEWLKNNRLAFFTVVIGIMIGGVFIDKVRVFAPATFGITLLIILLILQNKSEYSSKNQPLQIFLFVAMVISYFSTPFLLLLILMGIYLVRIMGKQRRQSVIASLVVLFLVVFLSWEIYWTWNTFRSLSSFFPHVLNDFISGDFLRSIASLAPSNIGAELPFWTNTARLFGWGLLVISTGLGLRNLFLTKNLTSVEQIETGGLLGVLVLSVLGFLGTAAGTQFVRYLLFAPFFAVPILVGFLFRHGIWGRRILMAIMAMMVLLSLPTFLSAVNTVVFGIIKEDHF